MRYDSESKPLNRPSTNVFVSAQHTTRHSCNYHVLSQLYVYTLYRTFGKEDFQLVHTQFFQSRLWLVFAQESHHVLGQSRWVRIATAACGVLIIAHSSRNKATTAVGGDSQRLQLRQQPCLQLLRVLDLHGDAVTFTDPPRSAWQCPVIYEVTEKIGTKPRPLAESARLKVLNHACKTAWSVSCWISAAVLPPTSRLAASPVRT